ncbi:MAG: hypothetical protein BWK76_12355 [Desulfobulbaceae bacterium A2]|nr:MAG: hypothetical protein BWK76_12355 [Desulfobulbaceae bacterium A2]
MVAKPYSSTVAGQRVAGLPLLVLLTFLFWLSFLARIVIGPLLPTIEGALGLDHAQAGGLFLWQSAGYFVALLGSGHVAGRLGHRRTIAIAVLGTGLALAGISQTASLWGLRGWLALQGLVGGLYLPSAIALITGSFEPVRWGRVLAVHELAPNLAFVTAPLLVAQSLPLLGWPATLLLLGGACLAGGTFFLRNPSGQAMGGPAVSPLPSHCLSILRQGRFWRMVLLFAIGITGTIGVYSILPLYLVEALGMEAGRANMLLGWARLPSLATALLGGWCIDRFGARATIGGVLAISGLSLLFLGMAGPGQVTWWIVVQSAAAVGFFPAGFAVLARLAGAGQRNLVISLVVPPAFLLGGGLLPAVIGALAEAGLFRQGLLLCGVLMLLGVLASRRLP